MARFDEAKKAIFDARSSQKRQIFAAARRKRTYKAFGWWGQQPFEWIDRFSELFTPYDCICGGQYWLFGWWPGLVWYYGILPLFDSLVEGRLILSGSDTGKL